MHISRTKFHADYDTNLVKRRPVRIKYVQSFHKADHFNTWIRGSY